MTDDTQDQAANHLPAPMTLSEFSRKGGRAGTGASKRRSREQMQAAGAKGGKNRWARLSPAQRSEVGRTAANKGWAKRKNLVKPPTGE